MGLGVAILVLIVLGAGAAVLTAIYVRAYGRAGYDDWGNYLAALPLLSPLFIFLLASPIAGAVLWLLVVALFGTPVLLLLRRNCPLCAKRDG